MCEGLLPCKRVSHLTNKPQGYRGNSLFCWTSLRVFQLSFNTCSKIIWLGSHPTYHLIVRTSELNLYNGCWLKNSKTCFSFIIAICVFFMPEASWNYVKTIKCSRIYIFIRGFLASVAAWRKQLNWMSHRELRSWERFTPSYIIPHMVPHTVPHTLPHTIPHTVSHTMPHTVPHSIPHTVPHTMPHVTSYIISYLKQYLVPYFIPYLTPFLVILRIITRAVPHIIHNTIPYVTSHIIL